MLFSVWDWTTHQQKMVVYFHFLSCLFHKFSFVYTWKCVVAFRCWKSNLKLSSLFQCLFIKEEEWWRKTKFSLFSLYSLQIKQNAFIFCSHFLASENMMCQTIIKEFWISVVFLVVKSIWRQQRFWIRFFHSTRGGLALSLSHPSTQADLFFLHCGTNFRFS